MPEPIVFWDIDGTIVQSSMERLLLRYLKTRGHISPRTMVRNTAALLPSCRGEWHRLKLAYLRNRTLAEVERWMDDCFESVINKRLVQPCLDAIGQLQEKGTTIVLLSGTVLGLAQRLERLVSADGVIAATPEIVDERYTGRLTERHPYGRRKVLFADEWLMKRNADWSGVAVIADNWRDRFLLHRAALPIVINPQNGMRKYARTEGWSVLQDCDGTLTAARIVELVAGLGVVTT